MGYLHRLLSPENLRRLAWLAFLGPFFFLSYNFANQFAAAREPGVPSIVFSWEWSVPFWAWTILPYWSSDFLYAASFLTCRTRDEIDLLGKRLLAIQLVSVFFFVVFPLKLLYPRPVLDGFFGFLFQTLVSFDLAYNEAPSLHVSLAWILWRQYRGPFCGAWFTLIALSTMTTHQHHFIDLPTGLWAGVLVVALLPARRRPECARPRLAAYYALGATALTVAAFLWQGWAWALLWPAFALSLVAAAYVTGRVEVLGKTSDRPPFWMWPYTAFAWLNSHAWRTGVSEIADGVWIGRPAVNNFRSVVDLTGELPVRADRRVPMLDLALPSVEQIEAAVQAIEDLRDRRPTLVCCALGYSRSAAATAAWLVASGQADSVDEAVARIRAARPGVVIPPALAARISPGAWLPGDSWS